MLQITVKYNDLDDVQDIKFNGCFVKYRVFGINSTFTDERRKLTISY